MNPEYASALALFGDAPGWVGPVTLVVLFVAVFTWLAWRVRQHTRAPADLEPDITGWGNPGEYQTAAPRWRGETVSPLDPADLPHVTTDDEALDALRRYGSDDVPPYLADQCKEAIRQRREAQS